LKFIYSKKNNYKKKKYKKIIKNINFKVVKKDLIKIKEIFKYNWSNKIIPVILMFSNVKIVLILKI